MWCHHKTASCVDLEVIDKLCRYLDCQVGDILST
ncbi:MAG TPA: XRE family transcriptional regulator [Desulfobacterales bacterium]|nr:XRE family transcriptional regulator [Desulfobacterales bacterium]